MLVACIRKSIENPVKKDFINQLSEPSQIYLEKLINKTRAKIQDKTFRPKMKIVHAMSSILATNEIHRYRQTDPWQFDPKNGNQ